VLPIFTYIVEAVTRYKETGLTGSRRVTVMIRPFLNNNIDIVNQKKRVLHFVKVYGWTLSLVVYVQGKIIPKMIITIMTTPMIMTQATVRPQIQAMTDEDEIRQAEMISAAVTRIPSGRIAQFLSMNARLEHTIATIKQLVQIL